jgi:tetracycline resistance efflux pump
VEIITLVPPAVVLLVSFISKQVNWALFAGIVCAALIVATGNPITALQIIAHKSYTTATDPDNLLVFAYLPLLGIIISLVIRSGGASAWGNLINRKVHTARGVELATLGFSSLFFLDDYFNSWTVGSVMHHVTDRFKVPRVKLAYLINILAPCLAIISPISSWIAVILGQLSKVGIADNGTLVTADPFVTYLQTIGYLLYPIIAILSTWLIVARRISFGPMKQQEIIAQRTGNVFGGKAPVAAKVNPPDEHGTLTDFLVPIGLLVVITPIIILWTGNYWLFGGNNGFGSALMAAQIFLALALGSLVTVIISLTYFWAQKKINTGLFITVAKEGFDLMYPSFSLLFLAWIFSDFVRNDLPAGQYLAHTIAPALPLCLVPVVFYLLAGVTAFGTGTAWGTIMVMAPIALPMIPELSHTSVPTTIEMLPMLLPTLGAIFSGIVAGTHLSPIADNTMVSSLSSACHHLDHVKAQIPYVIPSIVGAGAGFVVLGWATVTGMSHPLVWSWLAAGVTTVCLLVLANGVSGRGEELAGPK